MERKSTAQILVLLVFLGASGGAFAHPGHSVSGLAAGLMHPFYGMDHMLAMIAVGLWAIHGNSGRRVWLLPATFMTMLAVGAALAMQWGAQPMIEAGIAASVLSLGLLLALSMRLPIALCMAITALFGLLHGYAHGLELPESATPAAYALGFLTATAALHLGGIALGIVSRTRIARLAQTLGAAIAACGVWMLSAI